MNQAIDTYRKVTVTNEFEELERIRHFVSIARATALNNSWLEFYLFIGYT
jgi:hypothetical protein